jgi:GNAT superfamily N-acetyltransferase
VNALAAVLARAFHDDPPMAWLLPDADARPGRLTRLFATIIGIEALPYGGVDVACAGEEIIGGAIWLPPGRWEPRLSEKIRSAPGHWRAVLAAEVRAARMGHALARAHPEQPHWYLKSVGIDPSRQGRGAAGLLLRSRLARCDREGQPAYLEASKPEGVPLYERFGFRRTGTVPMPPGAPTVTTMWRAPVTPAQLASPSLTSADAGDEPGRLGDRGVGGGDQPGLQGKVMP